MKLSNRLLIGIASMILFLAGSYGFYIGKYIEQMPSTIIEKSESLNIAKEPQIDSTFQFDFQHVVVEGSQIYTNIKINAANTPPKIVARSYIKDWQFEEQMALKVVNDTLFIKQVLKTRDYGFNWEEDAMQREMMEKSEARILPITIHSNNIKSIVLRENCAVQLESAPSSSKRAFLEQLAIKQHQNTQLRIENIELGTLQYHQMNQENKYQWTALRLDDGLAKTMNFDNLHTELRTFDFPADSIYIKESLDNPYSVNVWVNQYLNVDLVSSPKSFVYKGNPTTIIKKERGLGRLINGNLPILE